MLKAVSLFSGAGGFCAGVKLAGFKVICAVESDGAACRTHGANFRDVALFDSDISRFLRDEKSGVPGREELTRRGIDLVYGGPPCQGFSQIGPRKLDDPRNRLYKEFVRVVRELQPSMFIMENVPNMFAMENGHFRGKIFNSFRRAGYARMAAVPLIASDFGVPQHRRRVFIFGIKDGLGLESDLASTVEALIGKQKTEHPVSVREAISDLPKRVSEDDGPLSYPSRRKRKYSAFQQLMRLDCDTALLPAARKRGPNKVDDLHNHHTKGIEARRKKIIQQIAPGGTGELLPRTLWKGIRSHKWRRLDPDKPSYTILAQMHRDLSEWIHPVHDRWITVREAARLQSFHDGFIFHGSERQQLKQVGNAVPPILAHAVARAAKQLLAEAKSKSSSRS
jgi:DNA (cytosine-5)-methyltransferase 1